MKGSGGTSLATYTYDYTGKRTSMTTASSTIYYHYASNNIVADYTWDAQGHPVTMTKNGATYYYELNGHGDVVKLTDASGNVVAQYQYDAYGNIISQSRTMASVNLYRYAGYRYDAATGLYYLMARYYDAGVGRFITRDTFKGFAASVLSQNLYSYCENNTVNNFDPSDHWTQKWYNSTWFVARVINALFIAAGFGAGLYTSYSLKSFLKANKNKVAYMI